MPTPAATSVGRAADCNAGPCRRSTMSPWRLPRFRSLIIVLRPSGVRPSNGLLPSTTIGRGFGLKNPQIPGQSSPGLDALVNDFPQPVKNDPSHAAKARFRNDIKQIRLKLARLSSCADITSERFLDPVKVR